MSVLFKCSRSPMTRHSHCQLSLKSGTLTLQQITMRLCAQSDRPVNRSHTEQYTLVTTTFVQVVFLKWTGSTEIMLRTGLQRTLHKRRKHLAVTDRNIESASSTRFRQHREYKTYIRCGFTATATSQCRPSCCILPAALEELEHVNVFKYLLHQRLDT